MKFFESQIYLYILHYIIFILYILSDNFIRQLNIISLVRRYFYKFDIIL